MAAVPPRDPASARDPFYLVYDRRDRALQAASVLLDGMPEWVLSVVVLSIDDDAPDEIDNSAVFIRARDLIAGNWHVVTRQA